MEINTGKIIQILESHKAGFGGDATSQDKEVQKIKDFFSRTNEDRREASKLAVDASKTLVTIGVAVFVALGGFIQFSLKEGLSWSDYPIWLFSASAFFVIISMISGLVAMSNTWKRGEGVKESSSVAWSTESIKSSLNMQAGTGLVALALFAFAIVLWNFTQPKHSPALAISFTSQAQLSRLINGPIEITGKWSSLSLKPATGPEIQLEPVADGATGSFSLDFK